jgi:Fur family ferric uptake transcriptional regulator
MRERTTQQLVATYDVLAAACDHPTAEQLLKRVRRRLPRVSLGTVYRNLEKLRAQGRLRVLHLGHEGARYDAVLTDHDHFFCEDCGAVADVEGAGPTTNVTKLTAAGYVVRGARVALLGLCPGCVRSSRTSPAPARSKRRRKDRSRAAETPRMTRLPI